MKKLLFSLLVFSACALSAQESYWTSYQFVVETQDEAAVYNILDDYFSKNKKDGVTVSLYENHFHDASNTATHMVTFSGSLEAMGSQYANDGGAAWDLFLTRVNQQIKKGSAAAMGTRISHHGDINGSYPIQQYVILDVEDTDTFIAAYNKFNVTHNPPGRLNMMGNFTSGRSPQGETHWVINGYADFKTSMGGPNAMLPAAQAAEREKAWDAFLASHGGVRLVRSGTRVLLGRW